MTLDIEFENALWTFVAIAIFFILLGFVSMYSTRVKLSLFTYITTSISVTIAAVLFAIGSDLKERARSKPKDSREQDEQAAATAFLFGAFCLFYFVYFMYFF